VQGSVRKVQVDAATIAGFRSPQDRGAWPRPEPLLSKTVLYEPLLSIWMADELAAGPRSGRPTRPVKRGQQSPGLPTPGGSDMGSLLTWLGFP
jgi:hypothetical protein